jgi:hypothetical protein
MKRAERVVVVLKGRLEAATEWTLLVGESGKLK